MLHRLDGLGAVIVLPTDVDVVAGDLIDAAVAAWSGGNSAQQVETASLLDVLNNTDALPFVYQEPCAVDYGP